MTAHLPHGSGDHITETRHPSPEQQRAIDLLEYATPGASIVRLSLHEWAHVNRVVTKLERCRCDLD